VIKHIRDTTAVLGDTLEIPIEAWDPDCDQLHFTLTYACEPLDVVEDRCPIAGIRTAGPVFWLWPRDNDVSIPGFVIGVSDGRGRADATAFRVDVIRP
jgi:hypothetical protein